MKLAALRAAYLADPDSPYQDVKANTAAHYRQCLDLLEPLAGDELGSITGRTIKALHRATLPRGMTTAHNAIKGLRLIVAFGIVCDVAADECGRLASILDRMKFPKAPQREEAMTFEQASAVVDRAIAAGRVSIAVAQALQFETALRQRDVIGEWLPRDPGSEGGIIHLGRRWANGVTFGDIDAGVLRKRTTKTGTAGAWDLELCPLVRRALAALPRQTGPLVVSEETGRPYRDRDFRRQWRALALEAGLPESLCNMDSRAGAASEAEDGGAAIEDLRLHMTHADAGTTRRYVRRGLESSRRVAEARIKTRSSP